MLLRCMLSTNVLQVASSAKVCASILLTADHLDRLLRYKQRGWTEGYREQLQVLLDADERSRVHYQIVIGIAGWLRFSFEKGIQ